MPENILKLREPRGRLYRLPGLCVIFVACLFFLITAHGLVNYETRLQDFHNAAIYVFGPLIIGVGHLLLLKLRRELLILLVIIEISGLIGIYAAESYLEFIDPDPGQRRAERSGFAHWPLVIQEMRSKGGEVYPNAGALRGDMLGRVDAGLRARYDLQTSEMAALGGVANVDTLLCRDEGPGGEWRFYPSDKYGFNNPKGLWNPGQIDVAAVGDSYTQGLCVATQDHMMPIIRKRFPQTLNLGRGGSGPLHQLAVMREYLSHIKPRVVVWFFTENNDLYMDLNGELQSPLMKSYLDPGFSQNLIDRQPLIDTLLKSLMDARLATWLEAWRTRTPREDHYDWAGLKRSLVSVAKLNHVRGVLGLAVDPGGEAHKRKLFDAYAGILAEGKRTVESWGGRLYVVFLPTYSRYLSWRSRRTWDEQRARVLADMAKLGIPVIDILPVFARHPDPITLFQGHYTPEGYRLVGEAVVKALAADASINQR